MDNNEKIIRVGSRKSELALIQTKHVISRLQKLFPKRKFEIHTMTTIGDRVLNISLPKIGEKSLFTRDLEDALRNGGVDFVVHSLKDLPTALPTGMAIGAVLEREDARDALVLREELKGHTIDTLPKGSVIGTSSLRRTAQIRRQYPHLIVCDIRGNLNTRLAKLDAAESKFAGIILAQAGLVRMGWLTRISQILEPTDLLYAVGQGALAVECRSNDYDILSMLQRLVCYNSTCRILAERSFLKTLGGGCSAPVAVLSHFNWKQNTTANSELSLEGAVWSLDGTTEIRDKLKMSLNESKKRAAPEEAENANDADSSSNSSTSSIGEPATKRFRQENSNSSSPTNNRNSPPVINDDESVENLGNSYGMNELLEKHINLAKKCPFVGQELNQIKTSDTNGNTLKHETLERGAGDADDATAAGSMHCPLHLDVGQDVMGKCPFVNDDTKIALAAVGKCPITYNGNSDETDFVSSINANTNASTSSKCPFSSMHKSAGDDFASSSNTHGKCPFLQKTVQMFDYADEEKPQPHKVTLLTEDNDKQLHCGIYLHSCFERSWYEHSNKMGIDLAEKLIKLGAMDVMKVAQAEIHGKA